MYICILASFALVKPKVATWPIQKVKPFLDFFFFFKLNADFISSHLSTKTQLSFFSSFFTTTLELFHPFVVFFFFHKTDDVIDFNSYR